MVKNKQHDVLGLQDPELIDEVQGQHFMIGSDQALALAEELDTVNVECLPFADGAAYRAVEVLPVLREKVSSVRQQHKLLLRTVDDLERHARSQTLQKLVAYFRGAEQVKKSPHELIEQQHEYSQAALEEFKHMIIAHHGHVVRLLTYSVDLAAVAQQVAITTPSLETRCAGERSLVQRLRGAVAVQKQDGRPHYLAENVTQQADRRLSWHQGCLEDNARYLQQLTARGPLVERLIRESMAATRLSLRVYHDARATVEHFYQVSPTLIDRIYDGLAVKEVAELLGHVRFSAVQLDEKAAVGYRLLKDFKAPLPERERSRNPIDKNMHYL
ncbi:MAG: hypothetical protein Q7R96_06470 [Nanoarchaeota archaeon]|nr:hypothetical protein [Nanoarchaeota archaeon]